MNLLFWRFRDSCQPRRFRRFITLRFGFAVVFFLLAVHSLMFSSGFVLSQRMSPALPAVNVPPQSPPQDLRGPGKSFTCLRDDRLAWELRRRTVLDSIARTCGEPAVNPSNQVPIVFIHRGTVKPESQNLAILTVKAAAMLNDIVYFLSIDGGFSSQHLPRNVEVVQLQMASGSPLLAEAQTFTNTYVHMNGNPREFELISFQRWFILRAFAAERNHSHVFYVDTDVLLLTNVTAEHCSLWQSHCNCIISAPNGNRSASGHSSLWEIERLQNLTNFIAETYTARLGQLEGIWRNYQAHFPPGKPKGGISDMTVLGMFMRAHGCCSGTEDHGGFFDHGRAWEQEGYFLQDSNGLPFHVNGTARTRLKSLHFQGGAKSVLSACQTSQELWR